MPSINWMIGLIIVVFSCILAGLTIRCLETWQMKLSVLAIAVSFLVFSGLGIAYNTVNNKFLFTYLVFFFALMASVYLGFTVASRIGKSLEPAIKLYESMGENSNHILVLFVIGYWVLVLFLFIYPKNYFLEIFNVNIRYSAAEQLELYEKTRDNVLTYFARTILYLLTPFYYAYLSREKTSFITVAFLFMAEAFLSFVRTGALARGPMIKYGLFLLLVLVYKFMNKQPKTGEVRHNTIINADNLMFRKMILVLICSSIIVASVFPLMYDYQFKRTGDETRDYSASQKVSSLLYSELRFPEYYKIAETYHEADLYTPGEYFTWLFTLPIPKRILPITGVDEINYVFSEEYLGMKRTDNGFAIMLSTVVGEGILMYGSIFAFLHAIVVGFIFSLLIGFYVQMRIFDLFIIYEVTVLFFLARSGSQGTISVFLNSSLAALLLPVIYVIRQHRKESEPQN